MRDMLFHAHSGTRYLVLVTGLVALLWLAYGRVRGRPFDRSDRIVSAVFTGFLDLQVLLGLALLTAFPFYPALIGHIVLMLSAAIAAHGFSVAARRGAASRGGLLALAGVVVPLVLVAVGIKAILRPLF